MKIKKAYWPLIIIAGLGMLELILITTGEAGAATRAAIRNYLIEEGNPDAIAKVDLMNRHEIQDLYRFLFDFVRQGIDLPTTDPLHQRILAIAEKYDIFS